MQHQECVQIVAENGQFIICLNHILKWSNNVGKWKHSATLIML